MPGSDETLDTALGWLDQGRRVALATVVETWGSSPRPRGSQLVVRDDGLFVGSVSGGCVEGKVIEAAERAIADEKPCLLEFGVSNETAWEVGLACGGQVHIYVAPVQPDSTLGEPLRREVLASVQRARAAGRAIVVLTELTSGRVRTWSESDPLLEPELAAAAERALAMDDASSVELGAELVFVQALNPALRLLIVGAVHLADPLSRVASLLGYEVTLIDPREAFARAERWPGVRVVSEWPDEVMGKLSLDRRTAVVALTHDPKIDDLALEAALGSSAFYIGALGSKKTHGARLGRLAERGFSGEALARIRGPVGLNIGARSPAEIAVAISAQMTEALRVAAPPTQAP